jgi:glucuronate isomerase
MSEIDNALFPVEAEVRQIAQEIYSAVAHLPIISPHGHVDPKILLENKPFANPAELLLFFDHYITRALQSAGVPLASVRQGANPQEAWRSLCSNWQIYAGTASGYWLAHELRTLFGVSDRPSAANAEAIYQRISEALLRPEFLPRALFTQFNIEFLATTDDPTDDVRGHRELSSILNARIAPTYRPDKYIQVANPSFLESATSLIRAAGLVDFTFENFIEAFKITRQRFIECGAVSIDIGVEEPYTCDLSDYEAKTLFNQAVAGSISKANARELSGNLLYRLIEMSVDDGLVVTLHAGVIRNHHVSSLQKFGPDHGSDLPLAVEFTRNLRPILENYGTHPNLHLILFCIDESAIARDVAPLAGFYPSVYVGTPWWFIDAPYAQRRFRESTIETIGFYKGSGFIDDTRAFLSIPARHEMARRVDAGVLARLVVEERISLAEAKEIAIDLVTTIPRKAFKL